VVEWAGAQPDGIWTAHDIVRGRGVSRACAAHRRAVTAAGRKTWRGARQLISDENMEPPAG
jgi:hypothetical protein